MIGGNCGGHPYPLAEFFDKLDQEGCLINYASYAGHGVFRSMVGANNIYAPATPEQIEAMIPFAEQEMEAGALGISYGIMYVPGASYDEILALGKVAAKYGGLTAAHARYGHNSPLAVDSVREMIQLSKDTGIPHQYAHMGSMLGYSEIMDQALEVIAEARSEGVKFCGDIYSYTAWSTGLGSAILDPGFFERYNCKPEDLEVTATVVINGEVVMHAGDRFTQELFDLIRPKVRAGEIPDPGVIGHVIKPEKVKLAMQTPFIMSGSDGSVGLDPVTGKYVGHPRVAGNFSRFLGYWVRELGTVDLMTALFKTSTMAALQLGLENKGRIALGVDADITIFDPESVIDRSTYGDGFLAPSLGIEYVIVNGIISVENGEVLGGAKAGKPIRRTWTIPGY
jgi:N-acyl-D-amino-acid deacylase